MDANNHMEGDQEGASPEQQPQYPLI
jgi:hypothetical protein